MEKTCAKCKITKQSIMFSKCSSSKDGLQKKCKLCTKEYKKIYDEKNRQKKIDYQKTYNFENKEKRRKYYEENIELKKQYDKKRYFDQMETIKQKRRELYCSNRIQTLISNKIYRLKNLAKIKEINSLYYKNNKQKFFALSAKRKASKINATPKWADKNKIISIYKECVTLNKQSKEKYHVDHIVPLKSEFVCGLHVEYNLRVIHSIENLIKSNKYWPDMP